MNEWQPIESAPKDGTIILATWVSSLKFYSSKLSNCVLVSWWEDGNQWVDGEMFDYDVTHWMPLPDPPKQKAPAPTSGE